MRLICDDILQVYVWVDKLNEDNELSPHFDYEDDAVQWFNMFKNCMIGD